MDPLTQLCICLFGYLDDGSQQCRLCTMLDSQQNNCKSQCGDGVLAQQEYCDDGNLIGRDGCMSCRIEDNYFCELIQSKSICVDCGIQSCYKCGKETQGYNCLECKKGFYLNKSGALYSCSQCDFTCMNCQSSSKNCLSCAIKYQIQKEVILNNCEQCENRLGLYTDFSHNEPKCINKCGDGILRSEFGEVCDDGNNLNDDGCSQYCKVDEQQKCTSLQLYTSICQPLLTPKPSLTFLQVRQPLNPHRYAFLNFSYLIYERNDILPTVQFKITYLNQNQYSIQTLEAILDRKDSYFNYSILIDIELKDTCTSQYLIVELNQPSYIMSETSDYLKDTKTLKPIPNYFQYSIQVQVSTQQSTNSTQIFLWVLLAFVGVSLLTGGLNIFWNLLDTLQILSYLQYINVRYPYNVAMYFQLFQFAQFQFLKQLINMDDFIQPNISEEDQLFIVPSTKFADDGHTSLFIFNAGSILLVFFSATATYYFSKLCLTLLNRMSFNILSKGNQLVNQDSIKFKATIIAFKIKVAITKFCQNLTQEFFYSGLIRTYMTVTYDLGFAIFLQFSRFSLKRNSLISIGGILAIGAVVLVIILQLQIFSIVSKSTSYQMVQKSFQKQWGSLIEGVRTRRNLTIGKLYQMLLIGKKFLFMMGLVTLYDNPLYQVMFLSSINLFFGFYLFTQKPLVDHFEYKKVISCEILIMTIELVILIYVYDDSVGSLKEDTRTQVGWGIITLSTLIIILQMIIDVYQHFLYISKNYKAIRKLIQRLREYVGEFKTRKNQKSLQPKVLPKNMKDVSNVNNLELEWIDLEKMPEDQQFEKVLPSQLMIDQVLNYRFKGKLRQRL